MEFKPILQGLWFYKNLKMETLLLDPGGGGAQDLHLSILSLGELIVETWGQNFINVLK